VLSKLNISPEEKEKVHIALLSYATGAQGQAEGGDKAAERAKEPLKLFRFSPGHLWTYLSRLATILVIVSITIFLAQIYGWPILSRATRGANEISPEDIEVTFDDVKGCDEAKEELQEVVEFLMNPDKFTALGGKLPKGCLLIGPPGTGKTLLARAVAGQAGVPFFYASGSEFDEVLVGQGARRVRDLFKAAKERAPCVIFLDEIDSVGSKRSSSELHPYANQTINQLLNEMDGFVSNEGVIVLGATNRKDDLDKALLRPGRFDTQVEVPHPDVKGRKEILGLYLSKIKHDDSVNVESLAARTTGFSGADLQNLVNTAAIRAAVDNKDWVGMAELEVAYDKQVMGTEWKSRVRPREDLEITAYHEAGHTLVAFFTKDSMPLHKVTILAKGQSGGHTGFTPPESAQWHQTKAQVTSPAPGTPPRLPR
jgi:ATP-dependent metalloprotease